MALKDKTAFNIGMDVLVGGLNDALNDDTVPNQIADVLKSPTHPLRDILKLIKFDTGDISTGQFIRNDDYIDAFYDEDRKLIPADAYGEKPKGTIIP